MAVCATSATTADGTTMRFGTIRCWTSMAESATSTAQKPAASAAQAVAPKTAKHATMSPALTSSTAGYSGEIGASQCRQRPRSRTYESTGMLSRQRISVAHDPHEDGGRRIDRRAGTRATTTLRKLPSASAGARTKAAAAAFMAS